MIDNFFKPLTITEAIKLKDKFKETAIYFAGGTQINSLDHWDQNKNVISIELLGLNKIEKIGKELIIGSAVTMQQLIDSDLIPENIKTASKYMINRNIRNMATISGNIAVNKSCSNLIPILISLKTKLKVISTKGDESLDILNYINDPKDYLIKEIIIPNPERRLIALNRFTRTANDLAILNVAVSFKINGDKLSDPIIAVGGIDKHVVRLTKLEQALNDNPLPKKNDLESLINNEIHPIDDLRGSAKFKSHLTGVMVTDCLYSAFMGGEK